MIADTASWSYLKYDPLEACHYNALRDELVKELGRANGLQIFSLHFNYKNYSGYRNRSRRLWLHLPGIFEFIRKQNSTINTRIKTLAVNGTLRWDQLQPVLQHLSSLTSLRLVDTTLALVPLAAILSSCTKLQYVDIHLHSSANSRLESLSAAAAPAPVSAADKTTRTLVSLPLLPLRSLVLQRMCVEEESLEQVLAACHRLQELQLTDMHSTEGACQTQLVSLDRMEFFRRVSKHCPNIKTFHVSHLQKKQPLDKEKLTELWSVFPRITGWGFTNPQWAIPSLLGCTTNVVTFLDLKTRVYGLEWDMGLLYDFLCDSPHLLHLKSACMMPLERLDLEGILTSAGHYRSKDDPEVSPYDPANGHPAFIRKKDQPKRIWACRGLRTLDMLFGRRTTECSSLENSRMLFSYLSKVCPNLEGLTVRYSALRLELGGGLCLLSRLKRLQQLTLVLDGALDFQPRDLEWISRQVSPGMRIKQLMGAPALLAKEQKDVDHLAPFRSTIRTNRSRARSFSEWSSTTIRVHSTPIPSSSSSLSTSTPASTSSSSLSLSSSSSRDHILDGIDMRHLGRIQDIVELTKDRITKNWPCWPMMEDISIHHEPTSDMMPSIEKWAAIAALAKKFRTNIRFHYKYLPS
ncbi:hypothetical protein BG004_004090 [Podila humilis]|nr:hypothetical protein BG004_004090 [Podila humilis]